MRFSIADSIATRCFAHPERVAVEAVGGAERMTYGDVWRRIAALAEAASRCAPGRHGRLAGLLLPNGADAALAIAACQRAGVVAVPVNGRLTRPEAQYVLSHADCGLLITGGRYADAAAAAAEPLGIAVVSVEGIETPPEAARPVLGEREIGAEPCVVGYTSGTTGFPKGAVYSHDYYSMNNYRWGWQFGLTPEQVVLITGPMFHLSYAGFALAALTIGARIRIMEDFSAAVALEELRRRSTFAFLVPSMLDMVAEEWETLGRPPLGRARHIITAGAPATLPLLRTAMDMFPNARIAEMYGWTEGAFVTYEVKDAGTLVETCVGWPALGADVAVFDEDGGTCPAGEPGEIGVRSAVPFAGYLGDEAATRAAHHRGYLLSGDIGRWLPDGRLCVVDRKKDVIITGGENVYGAEVERILLRHEAVAEAAVVGLADERWGQRVAAVLVVNEGADVDAEGVTAFCREHLAGYKVPRVVRFVGELPRNSMGKILKFQVAELLSADL